MLKGVLVKKFIDFVRFRAEWLSGAFELLAAAACYYAPKEISGWKYVIVASGIGLLFILSFASIFVAALNKKEYEKLRTNLDALNLRCQKLDNINSSFLSILNNDGIDTLLSLYKELNLGASDIITVYIHAGNKFHKLWRYQLENTIDRPADHPDFRGSLGAIWSKGWAYDNQFDTCTAESYYKHAKLYNLRRQDVKVMNHLFKTYFGINIIVDNHKIGILLIESNRTNYCEENIRSSVHKSSCKVSELLSKYKAPIMELKGWDSNDNR